MRFLFLTSCISYWQNAFSTAGAHGCPMVYSESKWLTTFGKAEKKPLSAWPGLVTAVQGRAVVALVNVLCILFQTLKDMSGGSYHFSLP